MTTDRVTAYGIAFDDVYVTPSGRPIQKVDIQEWARACFGVVPACDHETDYALVTEAFKAGSATGVRRWSCPRCHVTFKREHIPVPPVHVLRSPQDGDPAPDA